MSPEQTATVNASTVRYGLDNASQKQRDIFFAYVQSVLDYLSIPDLPAQANRGKGHEEAAMQRKKDFLAVVKAENDEELRQISTLTDPRIVVSTDPNVQFQAIDEKVQNVLKLYFSAIELLKAVPRMPKPNISSFSFDSISKDFNDKTEINLGDYLDTQLNILKAERTQAASHVEVEQFLKRLALYKADLKYFKKAFKESASKKLAKQIQQLNARVAMQEFKKDCDEIRDEIEKENLGNSELLDDEIPLNIRHSDIKFFKEILQFQKEIYTEVCSNEVKAFYNNHAVVVEEIDKFFQPFFEQVAVLEASCKAEQDRMVNQEALYQNETNEIETLNKESDRITGQSTIEAEEYKENKNIQKNQDDKNKEPSGVSNLQNEVPVAENAADSDSNTEVQNDLVATTKKPTAFKHPAPNEMNNQPAASEAETGSSANPDAKVETVTSNKDKAVTEAAPAPVYAKKEDVEALSKVLESYLKISSPRPTDLFFRNKEILRKKRVRVENAQKILTGLKGKDGRVLQSDFIELISSVDPFGTFGFNEDSVLETTATRKTSLFEAKFFLSTKSRFVRLWERNGMKKIANDLWIDYKMVNPANQLLQEPTNKPTPAPQA